MEIIQTSIPDVLIIKPTIYKDDRGYFFESFHQDHLRKAGVSMDFVQDNESRSEKNVLRGLHFQTPPHAQGKLVRVIKGAVIDVAVDIRKKSPWYGQCVSLQLSEENKHLLWIPPGFAHGFLTLENDTIFSYKCTAYYNKASEGGLRWNDPELAIDWSITDPVLSEKDNNLPLFNDFSSPF
ncbi:MAG: dTDP-4-dehydrorhamnose 3,5-epimerase [Bacteroidales bacterium]|nr:dTDP-4-dehydrorhamnose 3,5-epimerase [Bacteroidales bacterium]MDZ4204065.1 dTDP-4-dehydrorhamnose 3,5-epimerase [Bacteroidales bacterium]